MLAFLLYNLGYGESILSAPLVNCHTVLSLHWLPASYPLCFQGCEISPRVTLMLVFCQCYFLWDTIILFFITNFYIYVGKFDSPGCVSTVSWTQAIFPWSAASCITPFTFYSNFTFSVILLICCIFISVGQGPLSTIHFMVKVTEFMTGRQITQLHNLLPVHKQDNRWPITQTLRSDMIDHWSWCAPVHLCSELWAEGLEAVGTLCNHSQLIYHDNWDFFFFAIQ